MREESAEQRRPLRSGLTTGSCATACSAAAARLLLSGKTSEHSQISLPRGERVTLILSDCRQLSERRAYAATIKDAGDDPDVTHRATVFTTVELRELPGISFAAARGVGTITRPGLSLPVGEPAINPVPRQMMRDNLAAVASEYGYRGGFTVAIGVENGEQLAQKTMNPRLGIVGGLSILGTTGIVRPFSCSAYIASIHQGIDVALAAGYQHLAACTGNSSEQTMREHYRLDDTALIEMGDFAGAVFKHLKRVAVPRLTLCGGFGKISKLANGHLDLHSRASSVDLAQLARLARKWGAGRSLATAVENANTSIEALSLCQQAGIDLAAAVCDAALAQARRVVPARTALEVFAVNRCGAIVGHASECRS